jgi:hypothetical protein
VTSVDDTAAAAAIVDALNRISASATVPVSIHDERSYRSSHYYPSEHLAALTDPSSRSELLAGKGEHGLWYEYAMVMLHRALGDLDTAIMSMPAPVRTAITAELETEARGTSAHGESVLDCVLVSRPTVGELTDLLSLVETGSEQMSRWAETPVGGALAGTAFIVTSRDGDH